MPSMHTFKFPTVHRWVPQCDNPGTILDELSSYLFVTYIEIDLSENLLNIVGNVLGLVASMGSILLLTASF